MPKTLLLADDSITIQKVVAITFANEDFRITSVDNGEDAIAKAREMRPDIVLADVVMPRKNGYEVCEAIKADPALKSIPVLLLAGTFEAFDEGRARAVSADGHISKPFESQALIDRVRSLVLGSGPAVAPTVLAASAVTPAHPPPGGVPAGQRPTMVGGPAIRFTPGGASAPTGVPSFSLPPQPIGPATPQPPLPGLGSIPGVAPRPPQAPPPASSFPTPSVGLPPIPSALPPPTGMRPTGAPLPPLGKLPPLGVPPGGLPPAGLRPPGAPLPSFASPPGIRSAPLPPPGAIPGPGQLAGLRPPGAPGAPLPSLGSGLARPNAPLPPPPAAPAPNLAASPPATGSFAARPAMPPPSARIQRDPFGLGPIPTPKAPEPAPAAPAPVAAPPPEPKPEVSTVLFSPSLPEEDVLFEEPGQPVPPPPAPDMGPSEDLSFDEPSMEPPIEVKVDLAAAQAEALAVPAFLAPAPEVAPVLPSVPVVEVAAIAEAELQIDAEEDFSSLNGQTVPEPAPAPPPPKPMGHRPASGTLHEAVVASTGSAPLDARSDGEAELREALSKASREVIERIAWEVVPQLAETIIKRELERLIAARQKQ